MVEKATQIQCLKATTPWWPRRVNRAEVRKERGGINCREEAQKDGTRAEVRREGAGPAGRHEQERRSQPQEMEGAR